MVLTAHAVAAITAIDARARPIRLSGAFRGCPVRGGRRHRKRTLRRRGGGTAMIGGLVMAVAP